jgi:hypothetical protein
MRFITVKRRSAAVFTLIILLTLILLFFVSSKKSHFTFAVMGDSRGSDNGVNEPVLRSLLQKITARESQPRFILFSGDLVHGLKNLDAELIGWKAIVADYYPINNYYPAIGNHENNEPLFSNSFTNLPNEQLPGYYRTAYFFDYANTRFIVLNSLRKDGKGNYIIDSTQRAWLEALIKNSGKTHHFVMFHIPPYPTGAHYSNSLNANPVERDALWEIFDKYKITAVLVGHEHNYSRRVVDNSFSASSYQYKNKVIQLVLGGAVAPLTSVAEDLRGVVVGPKAVYHYLIVEITGDSATFTVYDINNQIIDAFTIDS